MLYRLPFEESWSQLNVNCNYKFEGFVFNWKCRSSFNLLADDNQNHMFMLINCWVLDHVCRFLNKTFRWFKYVYIKKWTYKISARFHSLTEMSRDQDDRDRNGPWPKRADRIGQTEKSRTPCWELISSLFLCFMMITFYFWLVILVVGHI